MAGGRMRVVDGVSNRSPVGDQVMACVVQCAHGDAVPLTRVDKETRGDFLPCSIGRVIGCSTWWGVITDGVRPARSVA